MIFNSTLYMKKRALIISAVIGALLIGSTALFLMSGAKAATIYSGDLIKGSSSSVYYYGANSKRYVFPNERTFKTWYSDFSGVKTITDAELAAIAIGGNATYRPGVKMVKITTDPKVYAVTSGGLLRWIASEEVAVSLYGSNWNQQIEDVPDAFFVNYQTGNAISSSSDFDRSAITNSATSINFDKGLVSVETPVQSTPEASSGGPAILFTDIVSGPSTGGQDNLGAFITIWGEGIGGSRGSSTVTIGGREVAKHVNWGENNAIARGLDMIVVQPGGNAASGNIVVTVSGRASNTLPFTVRSGNIYFVIPGATGASDSNTGSYTSPWRTIYQPRRVMQAGDIVYIKGGTISSSDPDHPGWDALLLLSSDTDPQGTSDRPVSYIGYPGDRPILSSPSSNRRGIMMDQMSYYVIANLEFTGDSATLGLAGTGHRAIGNYTHDSLNYSEGGVIGVTGNTSGLKIYGNYLRDNGGTDEGLSSHGLYIQGFGTNQDIDFGWNQIKDQRGRRAIQLFGHVAGDKMDNIRLHDNLISGSVRNNIILGGSDGGTEVIGTIYVYNNIIANGDDQGLRINDPQGTVYIQNNTFYNNGLSGYDGNAQIYIQNGGAGRITVQNNIIYAEAGETYYQLEPGVSSSVLNASNNLVYNAGGCPTWESGCVNADPQFTNRSSTDFRPKIGSPAINTGMNTGISRDYLGATRPQGASMDIGAFEVVQ